MPRPKTGETPKRNIRIPDALWDPAMGKAKEEGRTIASVIHSALGRYIADPGDDAPTGDPWELVNHVMRQHAGGQVGPTTDLRTAVDAAADLLRSLGIRPVQQER
jgi:hypothetical protein